MIIFHQARKHIGLIVGGYYGNLLTRHDGKDLLFF